MVGHWPLATVLLIGIRPWVKLVDCLAKLGHCLTWWIRLKLNHYWTLILSFSFLVIWGLCQIPQPTYDQVKEPDISSPSPMLNSSSTDSEISQHESCTHPALWLTFQHFLGAHQRIWAALQIGIQTNLQNIWSKLRQRLVSLLPTILKKKATWFGPHVL